MSGSFGRHTILRGRYEITFILMQEKFAQAALKGSFLEVVCYAAIFSAVCKFKP